MSGIVEPVLLAAFLGSALSAATLAPLCTSGVRLDNKG